MKKKTKHIIIIILSVIVYFASFFIPSYKDLVFTIITLVIQLIVFWFGLYRSFEILEKIKAATKLLELINENIDDLNTYNGICSLILFEVNDLRLKEYNKYVELLEQTKKQCLKFNKPYNTAWWFKPYDWETRIKYLKSYL